MEKWVKLIFFVVIVFSQSFVFCLLNGEDGEFQSAEIQTLANLSDEPKEEHNSLGGDSVLEPLEEIGADINLQNTVTTTPPSDIFNENLKPSSSDLPPNSKNENESQNAVEQTLLLLAQGNEETHLSQEYKDAVLVLGNTGAGKSTMTLFLAGNNSDLIAYEKDPVTILIRDGREKISTSTITSKTIFPELVIDPETNTAFYDCPGFSDTRSTPIEIANAFFIKKVADHTERVKILLVVNHNSVKPGGDRKDFLLLIKHTRDFLRNTEVFNNSIALLVTKVESTRSDLRIINGIAQFMENARSQLDQVLNDPNDVKATERLIDILLQKDSQGTYNKITFFRQPEDIGPLSENEEVQLRKEHMKQVIQNLHFAEKSASDFGYSLSPQAYYDIGQITAYFHLKISEYFKNVDHAIFSHYEQIFKANLNPSQNKTEIVSLSSIEEELKIFFQNKIFMEEIKNTFIKNETQLSPTEIVRTVLTRVVWPNILQGPLSHNKVKDIFENCENLDFLEKLSALNEAVKNVNLPMNQKSLDLISQWLAPLSNSFSNVQTIFSDFCYVKNEQLLIFMKEVGLNFEIAYAARLDAIVTTPLQQFKPDLENLLRDVMKWEELSCFNCDQEGLKSFFNDSLSNIVEEHLNQSKTLEPSIFQNNSKIQPKSIALFLEFVAKNFPSDIYIDSETPALVTQELMERAKFKIIENSQSFVSNTKIMLTNLNNYVQVQAEESVEALASTLTLNYVQQFGSVSPDSLKQFTQDLFHFENVLKNIPPPLDNKSIFEIATNFTASFSHLSKTKILNDIEIQCEILDLLSNFTNPSAISEESPLVSWLLPLENFKDLLKEAMDPPQCSFTKNSDQLTAVVKGIFISLKEMLASSCLDQGQGQIQNLLIMASHTVFIDSDINGQTLNTKDYPNSNLNLAIISPNWNLALAGREIQINLNGAKGPDHENSNLGIQGYRGDGQGLNGQPGLPGGNAGNFLAIGNSLQHQHHHQKQNEGGKIQILTIGGDGGRGQDGGHGRAGFSAENVDLSKIQYSASYYGGDHIQITFYSYGPYRYEERDWACVEESYEQRFVEETFKFLGFIPMGTRTRRRYVPVVKYSCKNFVFQDTRASEGKRGGDGGAPGRGGFGGTSTIIFPPGVVTNKVFTSSGSNGSAGIGGEGGAGGDGGKRGNRALVRLSRGGWDSYGSLEGKQILWEEYMGWASKGAEGRRGENIWGRIEPTKSKFSSQSYKVENINMFVEFISRSDYLSNPFIRETIAPFVEYVKTIE